MAGVRSMNNFPVELSFKGENTLSWCHAPPKTLSASTLVEKLCTPKCASSQVCAAHHWPGDSGMLLPGGEEQVAQTDTGKRK